MGTTVNAGSALVEVWGAGSDGTARVVVLPKQVFMRAGECATGTSTDRVRYFGAERLTPQGRTTPWPSVLVVCQDPFAPAAGTRRAFGLAHVRFNAPPTPLALPAVAEGAEGVDDDVPTEEERDSEDAVGPTLPMDVDSPRGSPVEGTLPTLPLDEPDEDVNVNGGEERGAAPARADTVVLPDIREDAAAAMRAASMRADTVILPDAREEEEKKTHEEVVEDEGSAIGDAHTHRDDFQRGVVLAISGFVNPERARIRDAVTRYGGRYTNDAAEATHLVCAFADTPKLRAMRRRRGGPGAVVSKDWVFACAAAHRRLPEAQFALGGSPAPAADSSSSSSSSSSTSGALAASPPATPARKSNEGTKGQRRKKKRDPEDSEYESSGPDEYDLTDPFVVPDEPSSDGSVGGRPEEDDDDEEEKEPGGAATVGFEGGENLAETLREAQEFIREYDAREARRKRSCAGRGGETEAIDLTQMPRAAPRRRPQPPAEEEEGEEEDDGYATDEMPEDVLSGRLRVFLGADAAATEARRWCAHRPAH